MIVKFFKKHGKGKASSCKACVDYLLNKPDDTAQILQGDPRLYFPKHSGKYRHGQPVFRRYKIPVKIFLKFGLS
uniref:Truncated mobilization protein n=1 Tax=Pasteurella multocida TaxID=747 RepID=Q83ZX7_PASMD|nr:truncated mobilization protein [Pasteurella multocida]CAH25849.1 truncated mobilization protein [Actinobacillus pleuropneumoniae]